MNKKLVFITARLPYPANNGRKSVMYNYCKILHEVYGYSITIISFLEYGDVVYPIPDFIERVIELHSIKFTRKLYNLFKYTAIQKKYPMQVSLYYEPKYQQIINDIIKETKPQIVMADMVRTTEYLRNYKGYKIADLDDMLSLRYQRQLKVDIDNINIYGNYIHSLSGLIKVLLNNIFIKKSILNNEIKLLKKYEKEVAFDFDKTVFVAQHEADLLNKEMKFDKAYAVPLGVDIDYYGEHFGKITKKKNTIAFLGVMSAAHNEAGVIHFINNILPYIKKKIPDVKFVVVGGGVTDKLKEKESDNVIFTGRVDDVRTVIGACSAFVCPLVFGSGIKTKNLEAMAMGVPVVTTTIGAENINAINGRDWLVADTNEEFAECVVELLTNISKNKAISANAFRFVNKNFTWKVAENKLKSILTL